MISVLKDWLPMVISIIAIIVSVKMNNKNKIQEQNYNNSMLNLEEQKNALHSQERRTDELFMKLNSRSNLIPFFHIVLDDSKIEKIEGEKKIKLTIGIINIGKEAANNIVIYPMGNGLENYFVTVNEQHNSYFLCDYLSKYYAISGDLVEFSLMKEIPLENGGKINNFIRFKVRFKDLLGNLYEQEFEFGYDNYLVKGYNLKNSSSVPLLIEEQ
ncbi:TPA: hypothetical protein TVG21_001696 [Streptococcus equi subsp. zooepidemicus]|nr:Uncharacterised protein [Streptococcus pneumoniae]HEL0679243.1 hypothetical protein [Streptococcus equi subsp. zooepidemicus]HEL1085475.1 hypothetical protein [Streptococcus equi subsp. zooepidemicus]HEL1201812.1 hypothetical protein [Streptococcus equi subsp. zooepidemicus]